MQVDIDLNLKTHNFILVNGDTDSVLISKTYGVPFSMEERHQLLDEVNNIFPEYINFADDGYFHKVVVLKSKNYILKDEQGKIKIKGSGLKSSKIEKGLSDFMKQVIDALLEDRQHDLLNIYHTFIKEANNVTDISRWVSKKTVTHAVLTSERTNETKQLAAISGKNLSMGEKFFTYFTKDGKLKLQEEWTQDHDPVKLMERIWKTLNIFGNVIDMTQFPKYHQKNKVIKTKLEQLLNDL